MRAHSPDEICSLFQRYMAAGELEAVLALYDPEVAFLNQAGRVIRGREGLERELSSLVAMKPRFEFTIKQIVQTDTIALMHTHWTVPRPPPMRTHAIEVARRHRDGTWLWLIGDPFTVGKHVGAPM